jgi:hypothetical protein
MAKIATRNPRATGQYLELLLSSAHAKGSTASPIMMLFRILAGASPCLDTKRAVSRSDSRACLF